MTVRFQTPLHCVANCGNLHPIKADMNDVCIYFWWNDCFYSDNKWI